MKFNNIRFLLSAPSIKQCPADTGYEVAFVGRSNAGKSSALNTLTGQNIARTSKTPGRTQLINHFELTETQRLVDLPGYGYAKVAISIKVQWQRELERYLQQRESLCGLILLSDMRHPLQPQDVQFLEWAQSANLPVHLLLTKADKLKSGAGKQVELKVLQSLYKQGLDQNTTVQRFSSLKKTGVKELESVLTKWLNPVELEIEFPDDMDIDDASPADDALHATSSTAP